MGSPAEEMVEKIRQKMNARIAANPLDYQGTIMDGYRDIAYPSECAIYDAKIPCWDELQELSVIVASLDESPACRGPVEHAAIARIRILCRRILDST